MFAIIACLHCPLLKQVPQYVGQSPECERYPFGIPMQIYCRGGECPNKPKVLANLLADDLNDEED